MRRFSAAVIGIENDDAVRVCDIDIQIDARLLTTVDARGKRAGAQLVERLAKAGEIDAAVSEVALQQGR